jgi:hypothetical protein
MQPLTVWQGRSTAVSVRARHLLESNKFRSPDAKASNSAQSFACASGSNSLTLNLGGDKALIAFARQSPLQGTR